MRIYLGGYLSAYAAGQHWLEVEVQAPARLSEVLQRANVPLGEVYLVCVNGVMVDAGEAQVAPGDEVRLYPPVDGGAMDCRPGCGACCIAPSISTPIPGMPRGKAAGLRCVQLSPDNICRLFGRPERPAVCGSLRPAPDMCGQTAAEAYAMLEALERVTRPALPETEGDSDD